MAIRNLLSGRHLVWALALAALVIGAVALREGVETWRGDACCDAC